MKPSAPSPRPACTPEAGHLVSPTIRAMVPRWVADMVDDRPADALALSIAYGLGDLPAEKRAALLEEVARG